MSEKRPRRLTTTDATSLLEALSTALSELRALDEPRAKPLVGQLTDLQEELSAHVLAVKTASTRGAKTITPDWAPGPLTGPEPSDR